MNSSQRHKATIDRQDARDDAMIAIQIRDSRARCMEHYAKAFAWAAFGLLALAGVAKVVA